MSVPIDWATDMLRGAYALALHSPDTSTQNGAIVFDSDLSVLGVGWNGFTPGIEATPENLERPRKYAFIEHAERDAIHDAHDGSNSPDSHPAVMVAAWASCADCARAIVLSGITTLVRHDREDVTGRWNESVEWGDEILRAGGVEIVGIKGQLGGCDPVLFGGELWAP